MKTLLAIILLVNTAFVFAQKVNCVDTKNIWEVSFDLLDNEAQNIQFFKNGDLYKDFGNKEMDTAVMRIPFSKRGLITYDVALGGAMYLSFERYFLGKIIDSEFHATFLLSSNPFRFQEHVDCFINND